MSDWGPLDDFDDEPDDAPRVRELAGKPRRYVLVHDYVSTACQHRLHDKCRHVCKFCDTECLCVCHRWPVESM